MLQDGGREGGLNGFHQPPKHQLSGQNFASLLHSHSDSWHFSKRCLDKVLALKSLRVTYFSDFCSYFWLQKVLPTDVWIIFPVSLRPRISVNISQWFAMKAVGALMSSNLEPLPSHSFFRESGREIWTIKMKALKERLAYCRCRVSVVFFGERGM